MNDILPPSPSEFHNDIKEAIYQMKEDLSPKQFFENQKQIAKGFLGLPRAVFKLQFEIPKQLLSNPEEIVETLEESTDLSRGTLEERMEKLRTVTDHIPFI